MAYASSFIAFEKSLIRALGSKLALFADAFVEAMGNYMERNARAAEIERLSALSDAELSARGLTRDGIVPHVFRDRFCY